MLNGIIRWLKKFMEKNDVSSQAIVVNSKTRPRFVPQKSKSPNSLLYLIDPTFPELKEQQLVPRDTMLAMRSIGEMGGGFDLGSVQQQAMALKIMVNESLLFMSSKSPKKINRWASVQSLILMPRAGKDINAYYDRTSLRFFFFGDKKAKKNIFTCNSRSIVTHEFGHAFLDILRPDWWDVQAVEIWAFHESFGDITAILSSLQKDELVEIAIKETDGDLMKSNILTRLAIEMGQGLYNLTNGENGESPNFLRDASQKFNYIEPEKLPSDGRDDELINECHNFSRIFTSAFWEIIVKIALFHSQEGTSLKESVKMSADILTQYLLTAVVNSPTTARLFDAIAVQMLCADQINKGKYQTIINEVFKSRNILKPKIMMLNNIPIQQIIDEIKEPHEIQEYENIKIIRTINKKSIKLKDKLQGDVLALNNNPLLDLEIDLANECAYIFENDKLTDISECSEEETIDSALLCLEILNKGKLFGYHTSALFEEDKGRLIRKQIICTCGKPNYCDPNAPEYGKAWKPANNAGCSACYSGDCKPRSCDCEQTPRKTAPRLGCYTTIKSGNRTTYRFGSSASRKVC